MRLESLSSFLPNAVQEVPNFYTSTWVAVEKSKSAFGQIKIGPTVVVYDSFLGISHAFFTVRNTRKRLFETSPQTSTNKPFKWSDGSAWGRILAIAIHFRINFSFLL